MMSSHTYDNSSGVSGDPEAAAGGVGTLRESTSVTAAYLQNAGSLQDPAAYTGVGTITVGRSIKQASASGATTETTATAQDEIKDNDNNKMRGLLHDKLAASSSQRGKNLILDSTMANLKQLIEQQNKLINTLLTNSDHLSTIAKEKTKSPHMKEFIDLVCAAAETLVPIRNTIHGAYYDAEKVAVIASLSLKASADQHPMIPAEV